MPRAGSDLSGLPNWSSKHLKSAAISEMLAANFVANVALKDGLTVGALQNGIGYEPMMDISGGKENVHFVVLNLNWIGSMTKEVVVTALWNPPPVRPYRMSLDQNTCLEHSVCFALS